jgi:multiple sugar transport system substrate-binding protein
MKMRMSRRDMLKTTAALGAAGAAGIGANILIPGRVKAAKKLTIIQWQHFVPAYDEWFNKKWIKEWGEKNDTEVTVDNVGVTLLPSRLAAEAGARKGHDLFMSIQPVPVYEELVIVHKDFFAVLEW